MATKSKKKKKNKKTVIMTKSQVVISIIAIVLGIFTLIGTSYAVFKVSKTAEKKTVLRTGSFQVDFSTGEVITMKNMGPMSEKEGMNTPSFAFTITNTGTMDANYKVYLDENTNDISTIPNTEYMMVSYKTDKEDFTKPVSIQSLYNGNTLALNKQLKAGESITYEMKLWLDQKAGNEYQNTVYSARIAVESTQIVYDIATSTSTEASILLTDTTDTPLLDYKIYGNTENIDGVLKSVGDLVTEGEYKGKYKIGIASTNTTNSIKSTDIYLEEPLRKYDEDHMDYIDFSRLVVVRYTKEENNAIVPLNEKTEKKISLPYIQTFIEETTIQIKTSVTPGKIELKYFKD